MPLSSKKVDSSAVAPATAKLAPPSFQFHSSFFFPRYGFSGGIPRDSPIQTHNITIIWIFVIIFRVKYVFVPNFQ